MRAEREGLAVRELDPRELEVDLGELGELLAVGGWGLVVVRDLDRGDDLLVLALLPLAADPLEDGADLAFRRSRRWVLLIASTSSSFRIPCQPAMP